MANDVTIESISIEIKASAEAADKALEKLTNRLAALKAVTQGGLDGADKIAKGLKKLAEAAKSFESVDSEKLRNTLDALRSLQNVGNMPDISGFARSLKSLAQATSGINSADMSALAANMQSLVSAVQPLSGLQGIGDISNAVKALEKLPKAAKGLSQMDMGTFAQQMQQAAAAIQPFAAQMSTLTSSMATLPEPIQRAVAGLLNFRQQSEQAAQSSRKLNKALNFANLTAFYFTTKKIVSVMSGFVNSSNAYVENLNLFTVTMGEAADEALKFANTVNEVMGIDVSQWIQNQGVFKQITSGFGLVEEKANLVSKNLTQLGYDISSYFNISVEQAMLKLQSGISGELEPLRRIGYALDVTTLQQVAYNHGIETSINSMTQAQKAQIRYIAIMEQSKNAMGDMARTIDSPANQLRILESRIETLKRAIGDSLMPVLSAALPYVTAFVQILGEAFRDLAQFMGFELPVFDYSDLKKGGESIAASFDDATEAANKFKGTLAGIDQLNIIGSKTETGAADMLGADLNLDLPSYDFLGDLKAETSEAYKVMKEFLGNIAPVASGIAIALGSMFVGDKVVSGLKSLAEGIDFMFNSPLGKLASTVAATATAFLGFKKIVKDLTTGNGSFKALALSIGGVVTAVGLFVATKNPLGAVLTVVGSIAGAIMGWIEGQKQLNEELAQSIIYADNGGIAIGELAGGFTNYFDTISSGYNDVIANSNAMQENKKKIEEAAGEIHNITEKYKTLGGEITAESAETMRNNIETIGNAISNNLGIATSGFVEKLQGAFHDFAVQLGIDVDDMAGKFYLLESMGNTALASIKKQAQGLVNEITSGTLSQEEMKQKLEELDDTVRKMHSSTNATVESVGFSRALSEMDFAAINFMDESEVKKAIDDFTSQAGSARDAINKAWNSQILDLQNLKQQYINLGVDVEFDNQFGTGAFNKMFEDYGKVLDEGYGAELKKIDTGEGIFLAMLQNQLDESNFQFVKEKLKPIAEKYGVTVEEIFAAYKVSPTLQWLAGDAETTEAFSKVQTLIDEAAHGLDISQFQEVGKEVLQNMANGTIKGQEGFNTALSAVAKGGLDELKKVLKDGSQELGINIGAGIALGIRNALPEAQNTIADFSGAIVGSFKGFNMINSPSKLYENLAGFIPDGIALGIQKGIPDVTSAVSDLSAQMEKKMQGLSVEVPVYTAEDVNRRLASPILMGAFGMQTQQQVTNNGADPEAVTQAGLAGAGGIPLDVNVNVQSYVELDGDQVGEATTRYQQRQMAYSNGY